MESIDNNYDHENHLDRRFYNIVLKDSTDDKEFKGCVIEHTSHSTNDISLEESAKPFVDNFINHRQNNILNYEKYILFFPIMLIRMDHVTFSLPRYHYTREIKNN